MSYDINKLQEILREVEASLERRQADILRGEGARNLLMALIAALNRPSVGASREVSTQGDVESL